MEAQTKRPQDPQNDIQKDLKKLNTSSLAFCIWPPTQRTHDVVIARVIETLTTPSVLSKHYGSLPIDEADSAARAIEDEAFSIADSAPSVKDDGIEILQVYSKEISKRMLDAVKSRASPASSSSTTAVIDTSNDVEPKAGADSWA